MRTLLLNLTAVFLILAAAGCLVADSNSANVVSLVPESTSDMPPTTPAEELLSPAENTPTPQAVEPTSAYDQLAGLPIEQFFEEAFGLILAQDPERLVELGLNDQTAEEPVLTDFSPGNLAEMQQLHEGILTRLYQYDYPALSPSNQVSFQVFEHYLLNEIQKYDSSKFEYLVTPLSIRSWPQLFSMFFTESHPLSNQDEAEAYVARVHLLDEKIDQLIARLEIQVQSGVVPPRLVIELGRKDMKNYYGSSALSSPLLSNFLNKTAKISELDDALRNALVEELTNTLEEEVYPAILRLDQTLTELQLKAPDVIGLSYYAGGSDYYEFLLHYYTTSALSANEIHELGLKELERIEADIRQKFAELGYPSSENLPTLYQQMTEESGRLVGQEVVREYVRILQTADEQLEEYFLLRPEGKLEVVGGNVGGFYSPGSLDSSRPGKFFAVANSPQEIYKMKTIAYHEGIPGHHYQISLAIQSDLPLFRNLVGFDGYTEGWALYAEYLASELGWYADDPYGDLGRLQYEALRACRMIVDTGIHTMDWTYNQAVEFLVENTGIPRGFAEGEVIRYISYPGQAPSYLVGKIEMMRLREMAQEALGEHFDLRAFHKVVLENGSLPLTTLEEVVLNWIENY